MFNSYVSHYQRVVYLIFLDDVPIQKTSISGGFHGISQPRKWWPEGFVPMKQDPTNPIVTMICGIYGYPYTYYPAISNKKSHETMIFPHLCLPKGKPHEILKSHEKPSWNPMKA